MVYLTGNLPVGDYDPDRLANLGLGHGAIDAGYGYTYFDPAAGNEFSVVAGMTYNFENPDTDYRSGVDGHIDFGVSKLLSERVQVGAVGYLYQQLTGDGGEGATLSAFKSRVAGIGPQFAGDCFMSLMIINEDHYALDVHYYFGAHTLTRDDIGTRYVFAAVRILVDPGKPADKPLHRPQIRASGAETATASRRGRRPRGSGRAEQFADVRCLAMILRRVPRDGLELCHAAAPPSSFQRMGRLESRETRSFAVATRRPASRSRRVTNLRAPPRVRKSRSRAWRITASTTETETPS